MKAKDAGSIKSPQNNMTQCYISPVQVGTIRPDNQTYDRLTEDDISRMLELYKTRYMPAQQEPTE